MKKYYIYINRYGSASHSYYYADNEAIINLAEEYVTNAKEKPNIIFTEIKYEEIPSDVRHYMESYPLGFNIAYADELARLY